MTIRTKLTLWYATVLFAALLLCGMLLYKEWVMDPRADAVSVNSESVGETVHDLLENLLYSALPAAILGLGGGWILTRKVLNPVVSLTEAARQITENLLHLQLPRSGNGDELDCLTEVFNGMTERLAASFQRIRGFNLHASHELKTPLTIMRAGLETTLGDPSVHGEVREHLQDVLMEIDRLTRIIDSLTLLTKADSLLVRMENGPVDLTSLVKETYEDGLVLAVPRGISLTVELPGAVAMIGDRNRLRQLLLNLLDNAVKYNRDGGTISMKLTCSGGSAEFRITNTGPGISPEDLEKVFDPFFRGDPSHVRKDDGCGLGLSIARWIVTAHHGAIGMTSSPQGEATVTVSLPLGEVHPSQT